MKKKLLIFSLLFALLLFSLAGCGKAAAPGKDSASVTKVTLNEVAHSIFYAPMYVAIEEGYFKEEGIDLTLVTGFGESRLVQSFFYIYIGKARYISLQMLWLSLTPISSLYEQLRKYRFLPTASAPQTPAPASKHQPQKQSISPLLRHPESLHGVPYTPDTP